MGRLLLFPLELTIGNCRALAEIVRFVLWLRTLDWESELAAGLADIFGGYPEDELREAA